MESSRKQKKLLMNAPCAASDMTGNQFTVTVSNREHEDLEEVSFMLILILTCVGMSCYLLKIAMKKVS
jgi:hypothetical protein